jgi:predicted transcriptional regulator
MDTELFSDHFDGCPVMKISGRCHPVTRIYLDDIVRMPEFSTRYSLRSAEESENTDLDLGSILQSSISAEKFSDKLLPLNLGKFFTPKLHTNVYIS